MPYLFVCLNSNKLIIINTIPKRNIPKIHELVNDQWVFCFNFLMFK